MGAVRGNLSFSLLLPTTVSHIPEFTLNNLLQIVVSHSDTMSEHERGDVPEFLTPSGVRKRPRKESMWKTNVAKTA